MHNVFTSMIQRILYRIRFNFPNEDDKREHILPTIDLFLRVLEGLDRISTQMLGLEMRYRRTLKEIGLSHFFYIVELTLHWPQQLPLGTWPEPEALRIWMSRIRHDIVFASRSDGPSTLSDRWNQWADGIGLSQTFVYTRLKEQQLAPLLQDIDRAVTTLGGSHSVQLE